MPTFKVGDKAVCVNMVRPDCRFLNGVVVEVIQGLHRESWGDVEGVHWCYRIRVPSGVGLDGRREGIIMPHKLRPLLKPKPRQRNRRRAKPREPVNATPRNVCKQRELEPV